MSFIKEADLDKVKKASTSIDTYALNWSIEKGPMTQERLEREIAESFLLTSPLSLSLLSLTGQPPCKLEATKENEVLFKMLDLKPFPPLDRNPVNYQNDPKNT